MCFTVSIFSNTHIIESTVGALFEDAEEYKPFFHVSGFAHPDLPIVVGSDSKHLVMASWGLIPTWVRTAEEASAMAKNTLNARSETIFEKPSFRSAIRQRRALLPVDGFVEWRQEGSKKQPFLVKQSKPGPLTLGAIWEDWLDKQSGEIHRSFSIVTTQANTLMSYVHNNKQRMPVVIEAHAQEQWLFDDDTDGLRSLMKPLPDGELEAFALSTEVSRVKVNTQQPELLEPIGDCIR